MVIQRIDVRGLFFGLVLLFGGLMIGVLPRQFGESDTMPTRELAFVAPTPEAALTFIAPTAAPTAGATRELAPYPVYGPAAEIRNDVWLNTDVPMRLVDLRGQVVLLEFWGFECGDCLSVLSYVRDWHTEYADQGLSVIGIHSPQSEDEYDDAQLLSALARLDVPYPVAQDSEQQTRHAYGQHISPTLYLIDKRGYLRYQRVGEGGYAETETAIRALLEEQA